METPALELGPGRHRAIERAVSAVARRLAQAHGQRQFYALAQVQACSGDVGTELQPWVHAVFTTRADFEAWFALRNVPAPYEELRAALARPDLAAPVDEWVPPETAPWDIDIDADDLWWAAWLTLRVVLS